jgi:hypothetical protein
MTDREHIEAAADRAAELLGIEPDDIVISASAGKTPFVCLTAAQIEALSERATSVHVVDVHDRDDGTYVFADRGDAKAFEATVDSQPFGSEASCFRREEVVCDHADALKLIAAECEAGPEAEAASLESGTPVATHAWKKGEDAPYPDKLEAVEYTIYPTAEGDENLIPGKVVLWVGLHPEMGCVNVDAGKDRLEAEGWEVTDWGAA